MLPAGKTKKEIALQLAEQGMKAPEIAKKIEAKYNTVYNWLNPEKCRPKKENRGDIGRLQESECTFWMERRSGEVQDLPVSPGTLQFD